MKAAVIESPGVLAIRELPAPAMGDYLARCEILYGAVCAGTDTHLVAGHAPFCHWISLPAVLGHESIGRVVEVGAKVRSLRIGDLVTRVGTTPVGGVDVAWGGFAEIGIAVDWRAMRDDGRPVAEWNDRRVQQVLPASADPAASTMIVTWRETLSYLRRIGLAAGQRVLVIGSGGNGLAFAAHARNLGLRATIFGSPARAAEAARVGADLVDYRAAKPIDTLRERLGDERFDLILDVVGDAAGVNRLLPMLRPDGVLAVYGMDDIGGFALNPLSAPGSFRFFNGGYDEAEVHDEVVALMLAGKLDAKITLTNYDQPYRLEDIGAALDVVKQRTCVKPLIRIAR